MQNEISLDEMKMLLQKWAVWLHKDADNGLGFKQSSMNLLAAASANVPKNTARLLPYGVDESEVFSRLDRAVCQLPKIHRLVIVETYLHPCSPPSDKFKELGISFNSYNKYLNTSCQSLINSLVKMAVDGVK